MLPPEKGTAMACIYDTPGDVFKQGALTANGDAALTLAHRAPIVADVPDGLTGGKPL